MGLLNGYRGRLTFAACGQKALAQLDLRRQMARLWILRVLEIRHGHAILARHRHRIHRVLDKVEQEYC